MLHLFVHTGEVYRRQGGVDRFNQPLTGHELVASVPGRLSRAAKRGEANTLRTRAVDEDFDVFVAAGTDVREGDELKVKDAAGNTLGEDLDVRLVQTATDGAGQPHHVEIKCRLSRSETK